MGQIPWSWHAWSFFRGKGTQKPTLPWQTSVKSGSSCCAVNVIAEMFFLLFRCFFSQRPLLCSECDIWGVQQYNIHKCGRFSSPATSLGNKYGLSPSFYVLNLKGEKENCEWSIIVNCVGEASSYDFLFTSPSFIHRETAEHWNGEEAFFSFRSQLSEFLLHFLIVWTWPRLLPPLLRPWAKAGLGMIRANILVPANKLLHCYC